MSGTESEFGGSSTGPVKTIVNYYSSGGVVSTNALAATETNNCKAISTSAGSVAGGTLKNALSLTGRGRLNLLSAVSVDATARTIRCQVIIDGVTIFDATTSSVSSIGYGMCAVGAMSGSTPIAQVFQPIDFNTSCLVKVASSVTEADKINLAANYETWS